MGEAFGAELVCPVGFEFGDGVADGSDDGFAAWGEGDAFGALVMGVGLAVEVVEAFEVSEEVVEGLLGDPQLGGELGWAGALRSGVLEDGEVGGVEVGEAVLVQSFEHVALHGLPGEAQERADQRWPCWAAFPQGLGKGT